MCLEARTFNPQTNLKIMALVHKVPVGLTVLRAMLGPTVLAFAAFAPIQEVFVACLFIAFFSDVFDGMIARRLNIATEGIRRLDSIADSIFYACAAIAAFMLYPQAIKDRATSLGVLAFLEVVRYAIDYAKYRKETSYHMWSSKVWGIFLFLGFLSLLGYGQSGFLVSLAIYAGIVADVEGLLISLLLTEWRHDVPTVIHALKIRQNAT